MMSGRTSGQKSQPAPYTHPVDDSSGQLTVGVELEFFVRGPPPGSPSIDGGQNWAFEHVRDCVRRAIGAEVIIESANHGPGANPPPETICHDLPGYWTIKREALDQPGPDWYPIEVASAVMNPAGAPVLIRKVLSLISDRVEACVNHECAFQVHIGRSREGFSLPTLKKLATVLWLGQERLRALYAPHRHVHAGGNALPISMSNLGVRTLFDPPPGEHRTDHDSLAWGINQLCEKMGSKDAAAVRTIWSASSVDDLVTMLLPSANNRKVLPYASDCSFFNLTHSRSPQPGVTKRTIEFRKFEGTLDPDVAVAMVRVCVRLVDFAREARKEDFYCLAARMVEGSKDAYSIGELLRDLGCGAEDIRRILDKSDVLDNKGSAPSSEGSSSGSGGSELFYLELDGRS